MLSESEKQTSPQADDSQVKMEVDVPVDNKITQNDTEKVEELGMYRYIPEFISEQIMSKHSLKNLL